MKTDTVTRRNYCLLFAAMVAQALAFSTQAQQQAATPPAPAGIIPIEHFTKFDEASDLQLSPSGEYFAYLTGARGRSRLVIKSIKDNKVVGGARFPENFEMHEYHWVSDTRLVYEQAQRYPGRITPSPTGELGALDFDGKSQRFIYGYRAGEKQTGTIMKVREATYASPQFISPLYDDPKGILIAEHPWKERADGWYYDRDAKPLITRLISIAARKSLGSAPLRNATIMVDHNDQPRFAVGLNDAFQYSVSWRQDVEGAWQTLALPGFIDETISPLITEDNKALIFTAVAEKEPYESLYKLDLATKEVTKVFGFKDADVTGIKVDFSGKKLIGVVSYADKPQVHWIDPEDRAARLYRALYKALPNQSIGIASATRDGSLAIIFSRSDTNPGEYLLFNTQTMKADLLFAAQRQIDPRKMRPREPFTIKARDGLTLSGYVTQPAGSGPHPLVVLPHGGPHGVRDYWEYDWEAQLLASRGYAVLQLNFRGSGGFGEEFQSRGYRQWGTSMQDDLTDATRWAIEQMITQADRVCIYGSSYGGYAALQGAVREPGLYRCAIGYAGIYDLELMHSSADIPLFKSGRAYLARALGNDPADLQARSPVHHADKIKAPVLLIHGTEDWRADFEQATRMKQALEKHDKSFEWMKLSREGHGAFDEETRREVYSRILAFLDKHLKGAAAQAATN